MKNDKLSEEIVACVWCGLIALAMALAIWA